MSIEALLILFVAAVFVLLVLLRFKPTLVKASPEQAIIRNRSTAGIKPQEVFFDRVHIIPALDTFEFMNLSIQSLSVSLRGMQGPHCRDNIRADVSATFQLRIPRDPERVLTVAQTVGCSRASDIETLRLLFGSKFMEAIRTVLKRMDFEEAVNERLKVRDSILEFLGSDLGGFQLEDLSIEYLEQTPLEDLDPENILDAEGITKITARAAQQHVTTNKLRREIEKSSRPFSGL